MQCLMITPEGRIEQGTLVTEELVRQYLKEKAKTPLWCVCTEHELKKLQDVFGWSQKSMGICMKQAVPITLVEAHYDCSKFFKIKANKEEMETFTFYLYIGAHYLVLGVSDQLEAQKEQAQLVHDILEEMPQTVSLSYILFRILDQIIEANQNYLEHLNDLVETLEGRVLKEAPVSCINEMIALRKQMTYLRKAHEPLEDLVADLLNPLSVLNPLSEQKDDEGPRYFSILNFRLKRVSIQIQQLGEYITHIREAYDAQVDIKQNHIMKIFTIVTTVFLPLTLIAGWYGMNFTSMPELNWRYGYLYVLVLSVLSSILCLYCFKRKHWL